MNYDNIILIGMAAAGKSTVGRQLAGMLGWAFIDTDHLLEAWWGAPLQSITDHLGRHAFVQAEKEQILSLNLRRCVIDTGGSVVYCEEAMQHLQTMGPVIYLSSSYDAIARRLTNPSSRGLAIAENQSLRDLYDERAPLYERHAQLTMDTEEMTPSQTCAAIVDALSLMQQDLP